MFIPAPHYTAIVTADVDKLKLALAKAEGDIDVLLTNEWPQGLCDGLADAARPQDAKLDGGWLAV